MRDAKKKSNNDVGDTNYTTQFQKGKVKAVLIYLDVFRKEIKDDIVKSKPFYLLFSYCQSVYQLTAWLG